MVWHVDEAVFLTYLVEDALIGEELRLHDRSPLLIFQFLMSAIRKRHQVLVVLVSATSERGVQLLGVQSLTQFLLHLLRHLSVEDDTHSLALLSAAYAEGYLLHRTEVGIVVHLHLGILGKLEGVGAVDALLEADEDEWQAEAHHVVEVHDVVEAIAGRYLHPASEHTVGHLDDGIFLLALVVLLA